MKYGIPLLTIWNATLIIDQRGDVVAKQDPKSALWWIDVGVNIPSLVTLCPKWYDSMDDLLRENVCSLL